MRPTTTPPAPPRTDGQDNEANPPGRFDGLSEEELIQLLLRAQAEGRPVPTTTEATADEQPEPDDDPFAPF